MITLKEALSLDKKAIADLREDLKKKIEFVDSEIAKLKLLMKMKQTELVDKTKESKIFHKLKESKLVTHLREEKKEETKI